MDPTGGYQCKDAVRHVCSSPDDAQKAYNMGCAMRATASTKMNDSSSRSHALLQLSVHWTEKRGKSFAQLNLVDLAGVKTPRPPSLLHRRGRTPPPSPGAQAPRA